MKRFLIAGRCGNVSGSNKPERTRDVQESIRPDDGEAPTFTPMRAQVTTRSS